MENKWWIHWPPVFFFYWQKNCQILKAMFIFLNLNHKFIYYSPNFIRFETFHPLLTTKWSLLIATAALHSRIWRRNQLHTDYSIYYGPQYLREPSFQNTATKFIQNEWKLFKQMISCWNGWKRVERDEFTHCIYECIVHAVISVVIDGEIKTSMVHGTSISFENSNFACGCNWISQSHLSRRTRSIIIAIELMPSTKLTICSISKKSSNRWISAMVYIGQAPIREHWATIGKLLMVLCVKSVHIGGSLQDGLRDLGFRT